MRKIASMLLGMIMATGLLVGLGATEPLAPEAEAANYVSRVYTAPRKGQTGNHIVALQRRLRAAGVLRTEQITGHFGTTTESAVKRFQRNVGLEQTGKVGERTWNLLVEKTGKILITKPFRWPQANYVSRVYTSPRKGQTGNHIVALQRRLRAAGVLTTEQITGHFGTTTESAVKRFQRSVGLEQTGKVGERTWNLLVEKTGRVVITKPFRWPPRVTVPSQCQTSARVLCVDKTKRKLHYVKTGKIIKTVDARFGCPGMRTREGTFKVRWKSRHHYSRTFNSPMPYAMFFSGGQAVHYSRDFARVGYNGCSHGCVNIRARSTIAWIYDQIRIGDRVYVYWS
jgi:peptidoglycan hydrolase-like protein with peptidoglycan-binding domain